MIRKGGLADSMIDGSGMSAMLNGCGGDASFADLIGAEKRTDLPVEYLTMGDVDRMDGFSFEVLYVILWARHGFAASLTRPGRGHGGVDVIALRCGMGELLQCKSSVSPTIGWDAIKEVTACAAKYQTRFTNTPLEKVAVTNQNFNESARVQAAANGVRLVEREELARMLGARPITNHEFDSRLGESLTMA